MRLFDRISGLGMSEQKAIIDIGSNTVRLVIYGGPPRAPAVLYNEKVTAKLGRAVAGKGLLSNKAMTSALAALGRYATLLSLKGINDVETVATAAVRDAGNAGQFLDAVQALGLKPRLLSGEEEAITGAMGVMAAFTGAKGVVGDLGGGSLELTSINGENCEHGTTMPLGMLGVAQMRAAGPDKFTSQVQKTLQAAEWTGGQGLPFYLVGGSWRALARYAMHITGWPLDDPHGFELAPEAALQLARTIGQSKQACEVPGLSASRRATLPDAAALLGVLVQEIKPSKLIFSSWGLREGLLYRKLGQAAQAQDPMLAGIAVFAESLNSPISTATMVSGWTTQATPADGSGRENLRLAATMLALASMRVEPNLRAEQAVTWALRKRWIGLDAEGRAMLAMAALANSGRTSIPEDLGKLASATSLREALVWGLAIRLCRKFSGCSGQSLSNSSLSVQEGLLVLAVREPLHALCTDTVVKDLRLLAEWLALKPALQLLGPEAPLPLKPGLP